MAKRRKARGRNIQGILLFDKPAGASSNKALQEVKHLYFAQKAGHTGSLDPLATGLLPICFGNATRVSSFLLDADKSYEVVCKLGQTTTTGDAEGEIIETMAVPEFSAEQITEVIQSQFTGVISQIPPMHSALKQNGQRLYDLARQGIEVEREARQVTIHEITLVAIQGDQLELSIHCSKGTYVRTLVEDIGKVLGVGAHVIQLRRTRVGPFDGDSMVSIETLRHIKETDQSKLDELLVPVESALEQFPAVKLDDNAAYYMRQGQAVQVPKAPTHGWVRLYQNEDVFMGMGTIQDDGKVAPKRLFT